MNKEDYSKYYIQGSDHYLIPKDVFDELFNEMVNWREEAIKYKETKQKEFIDYLEDKICIANKVLDEQEEDEEVRGYVLARKFMVEEILSKYKSIIGDDK